jgi:hypothetical protein
MVKVILGRQNGKRYKKTYTCLYDNDKQHKK